MKKGNTMLKLAGYSLAILILCSGQLFAQEEEEEALSGRELLANCEQGAAPGQPNQYCMQYVFGLVQTVVMLQQAAPDQAPLFCIDPNAVSLPEVTEQVVKWLRGVGDRLDEDAYVLVSEALHTRYPCKPGVI